MLTDRLSDVLLTHSPEALDNLVAEGIDPDARALRRQHDDRLAAALRASARGARGASRDLGLPAARVRARDASTGPANVDDPLRLGQIVTALIDARRATARWCSRSTRARARGSQGSGDLDRPRGGRRPLHRAGRLPRLPVAAGRRRRDRDRLRRRPGGGVRAGRRAASRSARTPSGPVTLTHGTNMLLGEDPMAISPRRGPRRGSRRRARSRSGTATRRTRVADVLVARYAARARLEVAA